MLEEGECTDEFLFPLQSYRLQMTIENMNHSRFIPHKDYTANRLVSGVLQLASNTSLVVDETQLEQGQLDTTGRVFVLCFFLIKKSVCRQQRLIYFNDSSANCVPGIIFDSRTVGFRILFWCSK